MCKVALHITNTHCPRLWSSLFLLMHCYYYYSTYTLVFNFEWYLYVLVWNTIQLFKLYVVVHSLICTCLLPCYPMRRIVVLGIIPWPMIFSMFLWKFWKKTAQNLVMWTQLSLWRLCGYYVFVVTSPVLADMLGALWKLNRPNAVC